MTKIDDLLLTEYGKIYIDDIQMNKFKNEILPSLIDNPDKFVFLDEENATFFIGGFDEIIGKIIKHISIGEYTEEDMLDLVAEEQVKALKGYSEMSYQEMGDIVFRKMMRAKRV
ncbi:MAG: hypothetical protein MSE26_00945 [Lachnospiraceae bacterium]|nr:hypothetical protein [Lachnospiraceae bacterium]